MIRRVMTTAAAAAAVLALSLPAQAAWSVSGGSSGSDNTAATHVNAPTNLSGSCTFAKTSNTVSVSLTWSVSTSTIASKQKVWLRGNATGSPVTYASTTTIANNTTSSASDSFTVSSSASSAAYKYAVSALVGTSTWTSSLATSTATFTLSRTGATGSCSVTFA
jgi:hypothetical protein